MNIDPSLPKVDREISLVSQVINRAAANSCVRTELDERQLRKLVISYPAAPALSSCGSKQCPILSSTENDGARQRT